MAKRNFLVIGHRAHTVADWKLDDICGGAGRLEVLVRSITASLWKSHGIRRDPDVWLSLRGKPKPDITIHFSGKNIKYLNPDERSTAALIRNGLIKLSEKKGPLETSPGVTIQRESLFDEEIRLKAFEISKIAFQQKRKKIRSSLSSIVNEDQLSKLNLDANLRASDLSPEDFLLIAEESK